MNIEALGITFGVVALLVVWEFCWVAWMFANDEQMWRIPVAVIAVVGVPSSILAGFMFNYWR